ncbi:MAG TPA: GNAT family N-acetyltransferase [Candidatus Ventricola intestinavium]|nr:GNAT family N-acetyltransferase [Candidatus Ventricola intestinavium]
MITYRPLLPAEITPSLFSRFIRRQEGTHCLRRDANGMWQTVFSPFIDDWSAQDVAFLCDCLRRTLASGGFVAGALDEEGFVKGFVCVRAEPLGPSGEYLDLASLHVSKEMRGLGMGRALFEEAKRFARSRGAKKLYISAHSAVESQAFYAAMGCVDACMIQEEHAQREPYDRQMECML